MIFKNATRELYTDFKTQVFNVNATYYCYPVKFRTTNHHLPVEVGI